MPTVAAKKKPARKATARRPSNKAAQSVHGMEISPITGLYFRPLKPRQKTVSREVLKAALTDSL